MNKYFDRQRLAGKEVDVGSSGESDIAGGVTAQGDILLLGEETLLLDPVGNSPMKIFTTRREDLSSIHRSPTMKLPLRLTVIIDYSTVFSNVPQILILL